MIHILEADSIQFGIEGRRILSDVYIKCETGKVVGLLGRNGQGKSSLMKIIYGSLKCERSVRMDNLHQKQRFYQPEILRYLPQFNFIPKSLSLNRIFHDFELEYSHFQNLFPEFKGKHQSSINNMSGGERRLIELYVIVSSKTKFVILDEPFTHLNPLQIEKVKELLLKEKLNKGILVTDHMFKHVIDISDNIYVLKNGKIHLTKGLADIEMHGYVRVE